MSTRQIDNSIISADQRATQKDPLIMHIVVDYKSYSSKQQLYTDLLIASLKSERILSIRSEYKKQFDQWWSSSFRKIVLRAKPNRWKTVSNRKDSVTCNGVAITAPVRRSERDSLFSKLQVLTDLDQLKDDLQQQEPPYWSKRI
jgi:hypothetical protein